MLRVKLWAQRAWVSPRGNPKPPLPTEHPPFPDVARMLEDPRTWLPGATQRAGPDQPRSPWTIVCSIPKGFPEGFPGPPSPRAVNPGHTASSPGQRLTHAVLTQLGALGWAQLCTGQQAEWCSQETGPHR